MELLLAPSRASPLPQCPGGIRTLRTPTDPVGAGLPAMAPAKALQNRSRAQKKTPTRRLAFFIKRLPLTQACDDQSPDAGRSRLAHRGVCPMARPCRPGRCLGVSSALAWPGAWCRTDGPPLAYRDSHHHETRHDRQAHRDRCDHRLAHHGLHRARCDRWPDVACVDRARRQHEVLLASGLDARLRFAVHGSHAA